MRVYIWMIRCAPGSYFDFNIHTRAIDLHFSAYQRSHVDWVKSFYNNQDLETYSLLRDLEFGKPLQLSDLCDRIHAFLELLRSTKIHIDIRPDYNLPHLELYWQFACQYLKFFKIVHILDYIAHKNGVIEESLPSWAPHWDILDAAVLAHKSIKDS